MTVDELRKALEGVPGDVEVTVWRENAFPLGNHEGTTFTFRPKVAEAYECDEGGTYFSITCEGDAPEAGISEVAAIYGAQAAKFHWEERQRGEPWRVGYPYQRNVELERDLARAFERYLRSDRL